MTIEEINASIRELEAALAQADEKHSEAQSDMEEEFYGVVKETLSLNKSFLEFCKDQFAYPYTYDGYDSCISTTENINSMIEIMETVGDWKDKFGGELDSEKVQEIYGLMSNVVSLGGAAETTYARYVQNKPEDEIAKISEKYENGCLYFSTAGHLVGLFSDAQSIISDPEKFCEYGKDFTDNLLSLGEALPRIYLHRRLEVLSLTLFLGQNRASSQN